MHKKQSFIKGAIILGLASFIAKLMGLFFRWPVTMIIGDEGIGLYQLAYPVYMFIVSIMAGFPIAISRMISERVALGKGLQAYNIFKYSFFILTLIGAVSSLFMFLGASFLIKIFKWRQDAYYSLIAVAFAPLFVSIMDSLRGFFQGLQMMELPAISQIIEQIGRVIVGVSLTYLLVSYGISYGAAGASFGATAGALIGCIFLLIGFFRKREIIKPYLSGKENGYKDNYIFELLSIAVPISLGMAVSSIMVLIDSVLVPSRLLAAGFSEKIATKLYGQLSGKAHVLINVPLSFSIAFSTSLVPAISEVKAVRNVGKIKSRAESAVKVAMILGISSATGLFILADPILHMIFPGKSEGAEILQILSISVIFIVMAQTLIGVLQGAGHVISPVKNMLIGSLFKSVSVYVLTGMPYLNIKGAAISSIVGYAIAAVLNLKDAMKYTFIEFDIDKMLLRPLFSAVVMGFSVYIVYNKTIEILGSNSICTIISIITGIIVYIAMLIISNTTSIKELYSVIKYKK